MPQPTRFLTGLLFLIACTQVMAQASIDSLKRELGAQKSPALQVDILNEIATRYEHLSMDSSLLYANKAMEAAQALNQPEGQLQAYFTLTLTYANMGSFDQARESGRKGLTLAEQVNEPKYKAQIARQLGRAYGREGSYHGAIFYFKQSLEVNKVLQDTTLEAALYDGLGSMYVLLEEYKLAEEHYKRSMALFKKLNDQQSLSRVHNNIAGAYYYQARWAEALEQHEQALEIYKSMGIACLEVVALYNIGDIYLKMEKLTEADRFLKDAFEQGQDCEVSDLKVHMLNDLAILAELQGKDREAESIYMQAMEALSVHKNFFTMSQITQKVYEFYDKRHDPARALYYLELHNEAEDSLRRLANVQKIAQLTSEYEFEKEREAMNAAQEKSALLMQSELSNERSIRNITIIAAAFFVMLALSYFRSSRIRKRANSSLQEQNLLVMTQKQALMEKTDALTASNRQLNKLSEFKENLTHMIAHDLKNALNSIMAASRHAENRKMQIIYKSGSNALGLITNMLDVHKFEETDMEVKKQACSVAGIIHEARLQVFLLMETKKLKLELCQKTDVLAELDQDLMQRVLVNLLTNAIKYSNQGGVIRMALVYDSETPDIFKLHLQDYGEGISPEDLPHIFEKHWSGKQKQLENDISTGLGLTFCKMAVEAHKGEIVASSIEGEGTIFTITLPAIKAQPVEEKYLMEADLYSIHNPELDEVLRPYAFKIQNMGVHEVSRIKTVLNEVEGLQLDTNWHIEVEFAMYKGDQARFDALISRVINEGEV